MSSRCPASLLALAAIAAVSGCDREERQTRGKPLGETIPSTTSTAKILAASGKLPALDPRAAAYENNATAISEGQRLYNWMNCSGCHFHGGGGMGVALMDGKWRYGGRLDQIAASISEGRPKGMPAWKSQLTEQEIWQLAAYIRTLSGQVRKDAVSARADELANIPPQTQTPRAPLRPEPKQ